MNPATQPSTALACELAPEPAIVPLRPSPSAPWDAPPQAARVRAMALRAAAGPPWRLKALFTFVVHFVRCGCRHPVDQLVWLDSSGSTCLAGLIWLDVSGWTHLARPEQPTLTLGTRSDLTSASR